MRGSDFAELKAFAAIAERGNFARAAAHLGVSPSALSQTLRALETRLGVRLFNRTTRSVALTEAGVRLFARLTPALADLEGAIAEASAAAAAPCGLLRINAPRIAAVHYLQPMIGPFLACYPSVTLELIAEDRLVDIVAERFDAGVRLGERVEKDMVAIKLSGEMEMIVVAAPDYLKRFGRPENPRDLRHHRCLNFRMATNAGLYRWEFERGGEKLVVAVEGPLIVNEPEAATQALLDGTCLGYMFKRHVADNVASGALVQVLADWTPAFPGLCLYYPSRRQTPPTLRAFIDFVTQPRTAR
jgi:DNA-binding transcriptional LysR family regulator